MVTGPPDEPLPAPQPAAVSPAPARLAPAALRKVRLSTCLDIRMMHPLANDG